MSETATDTERLNQIAASLTVPDEDGCVAGHVARADALWLLALAGTHLPGGWSSWRDMAAEAVRQHQEANRERDNWKQRAINADVLARRADQRLWMKKGERVDMSPIEQAEADLATLRAEFGRAVQATAKEGERDA